MEPVGCCGEAKDEPPNKDPVDCDAPCEKGDVCCVGAAAFCAPKRLPPVEPNVEV